MRKTFTLGTLLLGCWLAAVAQTGSTPNQTPPMSTPPTFPQDQTEQTPSNPATPADPSAIPPDTNAPGQSESSSQSSNSEATTIQGCLAQSSGGDFMLSDDSGNIFQLRGDISQLKGYVGKEVQVKGIAASNSVSPASTMSSPSPGSSGSSSGAVTQFSVSNIHPVADACVRSSGTEK